MNRAAALLLAVILAIIVGLQGVGPLTAQNGLTSAEAGDARDALRTARLQERNARLRAEKLEAETARAEGAAADARREAAALAARVQQAEAAVSAAQAEYVIVERKRAGLARNLARRREPLMQLTAALQTMAHRPLALAALQPGSLRDIVHTRAVLGSAIPVVRQRTAALRSDLDRVRKLAEERGKALSVQQAAEQALGTRQADMLALEQQQRVLARQAAGGASREAARASELAEEARDLDALVSGFEENAALRQRLAALEGPVARPARPGAAKLPEADRAPAAAKSLGSYILPVAGRVTAGFGETTSAGARRPGIAMQPRPGAQVVAPAAGRVAFAGEYEGYGRIVIIEHGGAWTSLVTGLASLSVATGQDVTPGSPLGLATSSRPDIGLELRRDGTPVNPLDAMR